MHVVFLYLTLLWAAVVPAGAAQLTAAPLPDLSSSSSSSSVPATPTPAVPATAVAQPLLLPTPSAFVAPVWEPLVQRLAREGISGPDVNALFARMGVEATQDPMGRKVRELYMRKFVPPAPQDPNAPPPVKRTVYRNVITEENVARCRQFLQEYAPAFALAEMRFQVPKEIAVSLLFVETRLGIFLGKASALYTLASMAVSTEPQHIGQWLPELPELAGHEERLDWMRELMPKRAEWAYKELRALLLFTRGQEADPLLMPGSIYGAIGMCQFMPSNLNHYAVDGDGDGGVNLFSVPDAVASLSNYLVKNGWKGKMSRQQQHKVLKTYNRIDIYANTILVMSDVLAGRRPVPPSEDPPLPTTLAVPPAPTSPPSQTTSGPLVRGAKK